MSIYPKIKRILKPFFICSILLFLFFNLLSKKGYKSSFFNNSNNLQSQSAFADPAKKVRPELPDFILVGNNYLQALLPPVMVTNQVLGALLEGYGTEDIQKTIVEYVIEPGENLWSIANNFGISVETILWANNLNKDSLVQPGQKLIIPPVSGVIHHVKTGDSVSTIAEKYNAKVDDINFFNVLLSETDISVGDILVVPNGVIPTQIIVEHTPVWTPMADSYFICPIALPCRITQGIHWYNAVDLSHGNCLEPIFAPAQGEVLKVKMTNSTSRWIFGGSGSYLSILHPNGVVTFFGHIAMSFVNPGDKVSQGQIIALMGGSPGTAGAGRSTGCHLHFGVSGTKNPFSI